MGYILIEVVEHDYTFIKLVELYAKKGKFYRI